MESRMNHNLGFSIALTLLITLLMLSGEREADLRRRLEAEQALTNAVAVEAQWALEAEKEKNE